MTTEHEVRGKADRPSRPLARKPSGRMAAPAIEAKEKERPATEGLDKITNLAAGYARAHDALADAVRETEDEIALVRRRRVPVIRRRAEDAANARAALQVAVADNPGLFRRPRTLILHGIKCGFMKAKGQIVLADPERVVKLIRKHLPERFDELVKTVERPLKAALNRLSAGELRQIGVEVADASDEIVVKPAASDIDKLVEALLAEGEIAENGEQP